MKEEKMSFEAEDYLGQDGCCHNCEYSEPGCLCHDCKCRSCSWYIPPEENDGYKGKCGYNRIKWREIFKARQEKANEEWRKEKEKQDAIDEENEKKRQEWLKSITEKV